MVKGSHHVSRKKLNHGGERPAHPRGRRQRRTGFVEAKDVLDALAATPRRQASIEALARTLALTETRERRALEHCVQHLLKKGTVVRQQGELRLAAASKIGTLIAHPDGFGFVRLGRDRASDVYVSPEGMRGFMHGDVVEVRVQQKRGRSQAEIVRLVEAAAGTIVGQLLVRANMALAEPRSRRLPTVLLDRKRLAGARSGDWLRIEVERGSQPLTGHVIEVLGDVLSPKALIDLVVAELGLPATFPPEVMRELAAIPPAVTREERERRTDLTHLPFVTIDGEDAMDFDDAICVLPRGGGFEAWVAIADVGHYVRPGSALDAEAKSRGNSFYFPDRVIPMLPEKLSNGVCSLNPHVIRLAMVVRMRFDTGGRRRAVHCCEAVIRSRARLTYSQVGAWLEDGDAAAVADEKLRAMLLDAERLYRGMARLRARRGALDLDTPEVRAVIHEGDIRALHVRSRNVAHRLIEEMMLAANTAVVGYLEDKQLQPIYRVHEPPEAESMSNLNAFLAPFGLHIVASSKRGARTADVQQVLAAVVGTKLAHVLPRLVLRAMKQARYSSENRGHFGLAYKRYCHFTSPIRRYADLAVHRLVKNALASPERSATPSPDELANIAEHVSSQERKQAQAEWDSSAMLAALYHGKDVGKVFDATISGVTERRIFFELEPTLAEGAVAVDRLPGRYTFDTKNHRLVDRASGHAFSLGDRLPVRIDATDPVRGTIDLSLGEPA